ncbi:tetratricopeptide repeat protein [Aquisphaera insulae]|uniref:tetratricopeptide repeat protein n=1 Tax=Aquisphaera insulae TaxID=2712864 RepID=UPI0013EA832C|nr:tetratricopeptide repeat protein [Aquisphaera insulae]
MVDPAWRGRPLAEGVVADPVMSEGRAVLWVPVDAEGGRAWDRIGVDVRSDVGQDAGLAWAPASAFRVVPRPSDGFLRGIAARIRGRDDGPGWKLPDGTPVERQGHRRADLIAAWSAAGSPLDEATIRDRWPGASAIRRLGEAIFLIEGVGDAKSDVAEPPPGLAEPPAAESARRMLDEARRRGDGLGEAVALSDLGTVLASGSPEEAASAVELLKQAATLFRTQGDGPREADALASLGLAYLGAGRPREALPALEAAHEIATRSGDVFSRKLILERAAMARSNLGDPAGALGLLDEAIRSTRELGDRQQEWRLHWIRAIALADLGRQDLAAIAAEESVSTLRHLGRPEAAWFEEQRRQFREKGAALQPVPFGGPQGNPFPRGVPAGPGLLRMAISATKAMSAFIASGLKTTTPDVRTARLATCRNCEHHTGLRCRICGCFTEAKSRMAHERCPLGRWPG